MGTYCPQTEFAEQAPNPLPLCSLQGSLRNLALDVVPGEQLATASAWQGRFNHFGNILGYAMGSLNLANAPILKYVGGGQFRKGKRSHQEDMVVLKLTTFVTSGV
jgi:hypothetical protein